MSHSLSQRSLLNVEEADKSIVSKNDVIWEKFIWVIFIQSTLVFICFKEKLSWRGVRTTVICDYKDKYSESGIVLI